MFSLGILEPATPGPVPGTVNVYQQAQRSAELLETAQHLKRTPDGQKILFPQPTDDPNDPLNWPLWKRDAILGVLCLVAVLSTVASPLLAADSTTLAILFATTFEKAALLTAYHLLGVAVGGAIFVPTARIWGKRHLFLLGALLMIASSAWGGSTHVGHNYTSLLWARIFQGVALAPFEGLINACVGDLYFVHERGPRMAFTNTCLFGGAFLTPVFVGMIASTKSLGWQWTFFFLAIFMGPGFLLLLFFAPETAYRRPQSLDLDLLADDAALTKTEYIDEEARPRADKTVHDMQISESTPPKATLLQTLSPFDGRKTDESFFKLFLRPFPLFFHPAILWACLTQGVIIGWTVMVGVILSLLFLGPPLFFNEEKAGYMYTSAFIGSILGLFLSGLFSEYVTNWCVRKNNGTYEPEFRILLVIPTLVFSCIGLYGFGITAQGVTREKYHWIVPEVFLAFILIAMVMAAVASAQYLLDAHREIAVEGFTNLIIFKNVFSFILAFYAYDWVFRRGISYMFICFGSIQIAICALSVPMYVLGKRNRKFFHDHDILATLKLRSERVHDQHGKDKTAVRGNDSTAPVTVELILMNPRYAVEPGVRTISTVATSTASEESLRIARAWLDECTYNHMKCTANSNMAMDSGLGAEESTWKPTHLLDVSIRGPGGAQGVRLVDSSSLDPQSEYVTLSHVWGRQKGVRLHKGTVAALRHGVAASSLPRTFAEAAMVALTLGFRYLWIDALCIMHDSEQEALREISMMDRIYGGGVLNLAATAAKDDTLGLIAERDVMALQPCVVSVTGLGIEEGLYKCLRSTVWQDLINSSPLVKRAWVLQERALARRTLHFTRNELLWECQQMCSSEVFPKGLPATMKGGVRDKDTFDKRVHHQRHGNWASLVKQYSRGRLSYSSDKLLALGGLARQYMHRNKLSSSDYVCGMWRSMLPQALLWKVDNGVRPKKWRAPSWAWTSIDGEVTLPDVRQPEVGQDVCLQIIQALVTTKADDPFGQVESARLQVRGFMARGLLRRTHDYWGQSRSSGSNVGGIGQLELDAACFDERLPKLTAMASHHGLAEQVEVYLLPVVDSTDRVDGLILCSNLKRGEFRRLGSFQALTKHDPRLVNLDGRFDHAPGVADGSGSGTGSGGERYASDCTYLITLV
ncbi:hypothetical protein DV738_g3486, partial [Chaetothyriales sp. CBS 135597]